MSLGLPSDLRRRLVYFFFKDTPPPAIYTLSLHDALPISGRLMREEWSFRKRNLPTISTKTIDRVIDNARRNGALAGDRKSTRLNSSHQIISYAVFCLKKKTTIATTPTKTRLTMTTPTRRP